MTLLSTIYHNIDREKFPFDFRLGTPPTYLKALGINTKEPLLFAFKKGPSHREPTTYKPRQPQVKNRSSNNYELEGNPLEDDCEIDVIDESLLDMDVAEDRSWTDEEETFLPISTHEARELLHYLNQYNNDCEKGFVWMLCQSNDEPDIVMLHNGFNEAFKIRGIVRFAGHLQYDQIDIVELMRKHFTTIRSTIGVETDIQIQYKIQPFLTMQLSWSTTSQKPSLSSYSSADIMLFQTVRLNNNNSIAIDYWRQLIRLNQIKDQIIAVKESENTNKIMFASGSGLSIGTIKESIVKIISDLTPELLVSNDPEFAHLEQVIQQSLNRPLLEITDRLWMLLKLCDSYEDLKAAFTFLFQSASRCNVVNVPTNKNRLAELIVEISNKRLAVPCLVGAEPLELLLEIGLEKAARDYEYIFTESKICGAKDLVNASQNPVKNRSSFNAKVEAKRQTRMLRNEDLHEEAENETNDFHNSRFNRSKCETKLNHLAHVHLLMEHLLLIQTHLDWSDMRQYVLDDLKRAPKPFSAFKTIFEDKREIPILSLQVISKLKERRPDMLKFVMKSSTRYNYTHNTFVYSISPIFPINVFPKMQSQDNISSTKNIYSGVHYLKIGYLKH